MQILQIDEDIARQLNSYVAHSRTRGIAITAISSWLAYPLFFAPALLLLSTAHENFLYPLFFCYGVALLIRFLIAEPIYHFFPRQRPSLAGGITPLFTTTHASFPSGHATLYFAIGSGLLMTGFPYAMIFCAFVAAMCIARIIAGVHYPSDVLGGALLGGGAAWIFLTIIGV